MGKQQFLRQVESPARKAGLLRRGAVFEGKREPLTVRMTFERWRYDKPGEYTIAPTLSFDNLAVGHGWFVSLTGLDDVESSFLPVHDDEAVACAVEVTDRYLLNPLAAARDAVSVAEIFWTGVWSNLHGASLPLAAARLNMALATVNAAQAARAIGPALIEQLAKGTVAVDDARAFLGLVKEKVDTTNALADLEAFARRAASGTSPKSPADGARE